MGKFDCEICGNNDFSKDGRMLVCRECGTKYTTKEARRLTKDEGKEIGFLWFDLLYILYFLRLIFVFFGILVVFGNIKTYEVNYGSLNGINELVYWIIFFNIVLLILIFIALLTKHKKSGYAAINTVLIWELIAWTVSGLQNGLFGAIFNLLIKGAIIIPTMFYLKKREFIYEIKQNSRTATDSLATNHEMTDTNAEKHFGFGLVPEKPIYTLARKGFAGETEYLSNLRTPNGERLEWNHIGSTRAEGINGTIHVYDIYLLSGEKYKTVYINMYGAKASAKAPNGFVFATPQNNVNVSHSNSACNDLQNNVVNIPPIRNNVNSGKSNVVRKTSPTDKIVTATSFLSIILTIISMIAIVCAMNMQDIARNNEENLNTTVIYIVLLLILGAFLGFAISTLVNKKFKLLFMLSTVPVISAIITVAEHSILSEGYYKSAAGYQRYINNDDVMLLNVVWITCVALILITTLIPIIMNNWYMSVSYRERRYARVAKIHTYLEKGIITEEEYEKTKSEILKYIEV